MHITHEDGAAAFVDQLGTLVAAAAALDDDHLGAPSRCRGWLVADVLVHVHLGLQEMLLGLLDPIDDEPGRDAATYWTAPPPRTDPGTDALGGLVRAVRVAAPGAVRFQGHVLGTGDFLATWAVELAVHHLDLARELDLPDPDPGALRMARQTVEALVGELLAAWPDEFVVLLGTGRAALDGPTRELLGPVADRLPAFG